MLSIDEAVKVSSPAEFQAVVLAGHGQQLYPLTQPENLPKALLPIANKPMIYHQLQWLESANIRDIIVVAYKSEKQKIGDYVHKVYEASAGTKIDVVAQDEGSKIGGTAEALSLVKDKIKSDFVLMSCDLITDMPPHHILDTHRVINPTASALLYEAVKNDDAPKPKDEDDGQFIGIDHTSCRLVYMKSKDDVADELPLRTSLLRRFPLLNIHTQLKDGHLYIFKRWVIDYLVKTLRATNVKDEDKPTSIRVDLLPTLVKMQSSNKICKQEGIEKFLASSHDPFREARSFSTTQKIGEEPGIFCAAVMYREGLCGRANTIASYGEMNRLMTKVVGEDERIAASAKISPKTQVGSDSLVGDSTSIGERCALKKAIIGSHCQIGRNVKIINSVIMDYAVVEDNVKLENCILCTHAKVQEKALLKDCEVGANFVVEKESKSKNGSNNYQVLIWIFKGT
ncbi:nucleotide-diphospho-sugar transferase [Cladochytrium replicatum]|nr:nucleotide-diphospho-sugar transferase [Cladochytrium replicatum]